MPRNTDLAMLNVASSKRRVDDVASDENTIGGEALVKINIDKGAELQPLTPNLAALNYLV